MEIKNRRHYKRLTGSISPFELLELINIKKINLEPSGVDEIYPNMLGLDQSYNEFASFYDCYQLEWDSVTPSNEQGLINIQSYQNVTANQKNLVYFDHTPEDSPLRDFHIVDFFVDEACVGIYSNHPELKGMHFFEFENNTYPLNVDFEGYMRLLGETKGFLYWQKVILEYLEGREGPTTINFKEKMPQIFPDFSWDAFVALYEEVRIDK